MSDEDLVQYRLKVLESIATDHQKSIDMLMRAMWMLLGAIGFTQVALPLLERMA